MNDNIDTISKNIKLEECSICIDYILESDKKITSCNHIFHKKCLDEWLTLNRKCPYCRTEQIVINPINNPINDIYLTPNNNDIITFFPVNYTIHQNFAFALYPENHEPSGIANFSRIYYHNQ